jgi:AGCS family alanine or glycine:cation symporter
MLIFGLFGMTMKYATCTLSLRYREIDSEGRIAGGPMYYIKNGLGNRFKWLAFLFALSTAIAALGIGNMVQSNTMADAFVDEFEKPLTETFGMQFLAWEIPLGFDAHTTPLKIGLGLFIAFIVGLVIIGGIKRIGAVAAKLVPIMAVLYVLGALVILFMNLDKIPGAFLEMFRYAFGAEKLGAAGGGMAGIVIALSWGARRAIFSNEAGLGSAPIAHAAAKTKEPVREGLIAGLGPFVDTIVICTMTALVIIITGVWQDPSLNGAPLTKHAFKTGLPAGMEWFGGLVVAIGLILFAISTAISWSYYGNRAVTYMAGSTRLVMPYRWLYCLCLFLGANVTLSAVWAFADMTMAAMAFFNLVGVIGLAGVIFALTKDYFSRTHEPYKP